MKFPLPKLWLCLPILLVKEVLFWRVIWRVKEGSSGWHEGMSLWYPWLGPREMKEKCWTKKKKWCKHQILELIPSFYRHLLGCRRPLPIGMSQGCGQHHKHLLWDRGRKGRAMSRLQINYHHFSPSSLFPSAFGVGDCGVLAVFPTCHFFTSRDYKDHLWFPCTWSVSLFWVWTVSLLCVWHTALYRKCWLIMSHPELGRWFSLEWGF